MLTPSSSVLGNYQHWEISGKLSLSQLIILSTEQDPE